jgi:S1-C subfamily serine protease
VEKSDPVFDKRFRSLSYEDLDLSRLWTEEEAGERQERVPVHHHTVADITDRVKGAVVNLYTLRLEERSLEFGLSPDKLLPMRIPLVSNVLEVIPFRVPIPYETQGFSLGTGFLIHPDGYILTNAHVVHNATEIRVVLDTEARDRPARIIGLDPLTDTALLKMAPVEPRRVLPLGDSDTLRTGEMVIAIGNPLGLNHTVTQGIVSARDRIAPGRQEMPTEFIQTDSAINPGSSGGPLINFHGEAVGINTALVAKAQSIGFAVPINTVKAVMPMLVLGSAERGWFGARAAPLTKEDAARLGYTGQGGVLVTQVDADSPAREAGMAEDDIITAMNGEAVAGFLRFRRRILGMPPGLEIRLTVFRAGEEVSIEGHLAPPPRSETD